MLETIKNAFSDDALKLTVFGYVLFIASNIFSAIAVNLDCKLCNIKHTKLYTAITVVFGAAALGLYFIVRRWLKQEVPTVCSKCGRRARKGEKTCPKCGGTHFSSRIIDNRSEITGKVIICIVIAAAMLGARYWVMNNSPLAESVNDQLEAQYGEYDYGYYDEDYEDEGGILLSDGEDNGDEYAHLIDIPD